MTDQPEQVTVTLSFSPRTAARLRALADPAWTGLDNDYDRLRAVLDELADHAQQGVYRSGAWERDWVCQVFGDEWLDNLEPDPEHADIGWPRPRDRGE